MLLLVSLFFGSFVATAVDAVVVTVACTIIAYILFAAMFYVFVCCRCTSTRVYYHHFDHFVLIILS